MQRQKLHPGPNPLHCFTQSLANLVLLNTMGQGIVMESRGWRDRSSGKSGHCSQEDLSSVSSTTSPHWEAHNSCNSHPQQICHGHLPKHEHTHINEVRFFSPPSTNDVMPPCRRGVSPSDWFLRGWVFTKESGLPLLSFLLPVLPCDLSPCQTCCWHDATYLGVTWPDGPYQRSNRQSHLITDVSPPTLWSK